MTDTVRDEARTKAALAVEHVMPGGDKLAFMGWVVEQNPQFRGASIADVLDIYDDHDALLAWREPFWEKHADRVQAALGYNPDEDAGTPTYFLRAAIASYATLACAVLMEGEPLPADVITLAEQARACAEDDIVRLTAAGPLPHLPAGVYQHYKGPLYLTLGYGHDANDGARRVVVYVGLQLDGAHTGPRLAVRDADDFHAHVCGNDQCAAYGKAMPGGWSRCRTCETLPVRRFSYVGPEWTNG